MFSWIGGITGAIGSCPACPMKTLLQNLTNLTYLPCSCYFQGFSQQPHQLTRCIDSYTNTDVSISISHTVLLGLFLVYSFSQRRRQWHPTPVPLAWKIPWTEEPVRLQSMGSLRVWHDWATSLSVQRSLKDGLLPHITPSDACCGVSACTIKIW